MDFQELAEDASKKGIEAFKQLNEHWQRRDFDVLVMLHRLMGRKRFLLLNREIVGVAEVHKQQHRHT